MRGGRGGRRFPLFGGSSRRRRLSFDQRRTPRAGAELSVGWADHDVVRQSGSNYVVSAPAISLISVGNEVGPAAIAIEAVGEDEISGDVAIVGTHSVHLTGGMLAYIDVNAEVALGSITLDCGPTGVIALASGLLEEPNAHTLAPEGISVASLAMIEMEALESNVAITPVGVTLEAAENAVEITAEGITLTSGPSVIEMTPAGIVISAPRAPMRGGGDDLGARRHDWRINSG